MSLIVEQCRQNLMSLRIKTEQWAEYTLPACPPQMEQGEYEACISPAQQALEDYAQQAATYQAQGENLDQQLENPTTELINQASELHQVWQKQLFAMEDTVKAALVPLQDAAGGEQTLDELVRELDEEQDQSLYQRELRQYALDLQMGDRFVVVFRHGAVVELVEGEYAGSEKPAALVAAATELLRQEARVASLYHQDVLEEEKLVAYYATCEPAERVTHFLLLPEGFEPRLARHDLTLEDLVARLRLLDQQEAQALLIIDWDENIIVLN